MDYQALGNACFANKEYCNAIEYYTKGLRVCNKEASIALYANRALCYIKLDCFKKGLNDTISLLEINPAHEKGIFRHVKCLWGIAQYEEALSFINSKLAKYSTLFQNKDLLLLRGKAQDLFDQSLTGKYDIVQLMTHQRNQPLQPIDVAEFVGPIKIRQVPGKGRGLIAQDIITTGQLLLCCKPFAFCVTDQEDLTKDANVVLVDRILEKTKVEPELRREVFSLYAPDPGVSVQESTTTLEADVENEILRLNSIIANNSFEFNGSGSVFDAKQSYFWSGLWILPSYINHSCSEANCTWSVYGDAFFVRAVRPIQKGEEILITYVNITWPYKHRRGVITEHMFECNCKLCEYEESEDVDIVQRRKKIFETLDDIYSMEQLMPKQSVLGCFKELESLRKDCPELNFCLARVNVVNIVQRFLMERMDNDSTTQCRYMFEKIHAVSKNTAHAKFVVQLTINILNCLLEDERSETTTIQGWIKQLKDDLIAAHGSPKALQCVGLDMLNLLKDMLHANDFL